MTKKENAKKLNELLKYCSTDRQTEILSVCLKNMDREKSCIELGLKPKVVRDVIYRLKVKRLTSINRVDIHGLHQPSDEVYKPIEGHYIKGESVLTDKDGHVTAKWTKTDVDQVRRSELLKKAIINAMKSYKGKSIDTQAPENDNDDLLCLIPIGDAHISMMAWAPEAGDDFDLKIAERDLCTAIERLVDSAPSCKTCIIADMGDFLHRNNNKNSTPDSGNVLDCDNRFSKMMRVAVKILIHAVHCALKKFDNVILKNVVGNHAPEAEQMLAIAMELYFHNNERVKVANAENKFWYYQFGVSLLGFCHGDKVKHNELPMIMASDVPEKWGTSKFRYFFIGHIHHQSVKEYQGCSVESINTLTSNDSWHHGSGYRARKNIKLLVFHRLYGEVERITKDISMIRDSHKI